MNKQALYTHFAERYAALKQALQGDDLERIKALALEVHGLVHPAEVSGLSAPTMADAVLDFALAGQGCVVVPRERGETDLHYAGTKSVPLLWQLWHTYRIEDLVSNMLMANQPQIFNATWQARMHATITDTGNALSLLEAQDFCRRLNPEALRDYMLTVARNTRQIIESLTLEQINGRPPEEDVMRILEVGGVTTDFRSVWLLVFWGRLTRGGMILTPMTNHHMMHLPACLNHLPILEG